MLHQEADIYRDYYKILDSLVNVFCVVLNSYNCSLGPYETSLKISCINLMSIMFNAFHVSNLHNIFHLNL